MAWSFPRLCLLSLLSLGLVSCIEKSSSSSRAEKGSKAPSTLASVRPAVAKPLPPPPYVPPAQGLGVVEGTVFIEGDPALIIDAKAQKIPDGCDEAKKLYPPLFREGPGRTLGDAFVGVTGYQGQARPKTEPLAIDAKGCAFPSRTYAITADQHLMVRSIDDRPISPILYGTRSKASLIAVGKGDAVPVFHKGPGRYVLYDEVQIFSQSTVLVMNYPTIAVTGIDGKFRIEGVPAGASELSVLLPAANLTATQKINVERDRTTEVTLKLRFDVAQFKQSRTKAAPSAAPAISAAPAEAH